VRVVRSASERLEYEETIVADLRSSFGWYPRESRHVGVYEQERRTIEHPGLGRLRLDCEILTTHRHDLRVVVYTAEPGTESARQLDLLRTACSSPQGGLVTG
jgi:hypothetical protein